MLLLEVVVVVCFLKRVLIVKRGDLTIRDLRFRMTVTNLRICRKYKAWFLMGRSVENCFLDGSRKTKSNAGMLD